MASWQRDPPLRRGTWVAYRQVAGHQPPMWRAGSRTAPQVQPAARWHREGQYVQYTCLTEAAAWAELVRHEEILDSPTRRDHPRALWRTWIGEHDVADLQSPERFAECGLPLSMMNDRFSDGRPDYRRCQDLADELRGVGYRALLSPSAALAGGMCLSLFDERFDIEPGPHTLGDGRLQNHDPDRFVIAMCIADQAPVPLGVMREMGVRL